jgi:NAD(P)-dependent dehydrogenase (short-subunit alcohol dehydrogenase family)
MKNYLVVGGSAGIGLELVKIFSAQGHQTWVASRHEGESAGLPGIRHLPVDITSGTLAETDLPDALHGMAYCPGSINLKSFRALKIADFQADFEVNVLGAVKTLQAAHKSLKAAGTASVVLFSTVAVGQGMPFHASIAAAKGAVEGLARALAAEWAPDIRVNCIAPSLTDTPLASRLLNSDEKRQAAAQRHPLRRVGDAAEMAHLAHFLLSENAAWVSGQVIGADGGLSTLRV